MTLRGRASFVASLDFGLDSFQVKALDAIDEGASVMVTAPTGSGKTVVAEYAVELALASGGRAFYTTPLKALSNQKFSDLSKRYGTSRVGLLTGDNSLNGDADLVVMTTEVLRNMIYAGNSGLDRLSCVILDEVHFLQDPYRGAVWEEVIIHAPPAVRLVCLSATVSNAEEVVRWISTVRGPSAAVIEECRPVELRQLYLVGDRSAPAMHMLPTFVNGHPNPEAASLDARVGPASRYRRAGPSRSRSPLRRPRRTEVVERLEYEAMLPAIYFIFSRAGCDEAVRQCLSDGVRLTTSEERSQIRAIADAGVDGLSDDDLAVLGYGPWLAGLESGLASHHAGLVPPFKAVVETCFTAALVKVVFATETLAVGINMPARTVVIEKLTKFSGERHALLTPGEFTQLTGRAGRRGMDPLGYAVVLWSREQSFGEIAGLASNRTWALRSSFRPTYNMAVNLVRRYSPDRARHLLNLSFAQYQANAAVVALESEVHRLGRIVREAGSGPLAQRAEREAQRLERRIRARGDSLAHELDKVMGLLGDWGYVEGWTLTPAGERLARIYHELDFLVAEALEEGLFDDLAPAEVAALASTLTFEDRGPGGSPADFPDSQTGQRWRALEALAGRLAKAEANAGLPGSRSPDPGFAGQARAWVRGQGLDRVVGEGGIWGSGSGGDFVRNINRLIDLLRQIGEVAAEPQTAEAARAAATAAFRGVVAASSVFELSAGE
ncbi:MAG: DEAD/DEAH box helicase [Acidimicrobiales bacterium]